MGAFCIGRKTVYNVFHSTRKAIDATLTLPGFRKTFQGLQRSSEGFQISRKPVNSLAGCVGALDGICVKIMKPNDDHHPATFYCWKDFYSIPVQAVVDYRYRFLCYSAICTGSTHDSLAHSVSALGKFSEDGEFLHPF